MDTLYIRNNENDLHLHNIYLVFYGNGRLDAYFQNFYGARRIWNAKVAIELHFQYRLQIFYPRIECRHLLIQYPQSNQYRYVAKLI